MLRIHQITSAAAAEKYYARGGDYYGQEMVGEWSGKGAVLLGLAGQVDRQAFDRLCNNLHPLTGERLTAHTKEARTVGWDMNFNASKGVSLLYSLHQDSAILEAFRDSVKETMADIEREIKTRVRRQRQDTERVVGNLACAEFVHFTTRPVDGVPDPALHAHMVVFNAVFDPVEQSWKAGFLREIKRDAPFFEALFHQRLATKLSGLGYAVERRGKGWDLAGVSPALARKFSRRTEQIERLAAELGIADPEAKARLGATSREHKADKLSMDELRQAWQQRLSPNEVTALAQAASKAIPVPAPERDADEKAVKEATLHLFERRSVVGYREILARALRYAPAEVTLKGIERAAKKLGLIVHDMEGRTMATIPEAVREEKRIIGFAKNTRGTRSRLGARGRAIKRDWLSAGQKAAVEHALSSTDQVILIEGRAGVGKTTLTAEIVDGIKENGRNVVMVAPSAQASRGVLRESGFDDADTLQRLLVDERMQEGARGNVILVDEAGLVGAPTMRKLFDLAERLDSRVILVGDRNQHRSIERGRPFDLLAEKAGLKVARVNDIRRQRDEYLEAVKLLAERKPSLGFDRLDRVGWVVEAPAEQIYSEAAKAFITALHESHGDALAISPTHAEIGRFAAAIRQELTQAGRIGEGRQFDVWIPERLTEAERRDRESYEPGMMVQFHKAAPGFKAGARLAVTDPATIPTAMAERFSIYRPGRQQVATGDRIRITANGNSRDGHRLNNGAVYSVAGFTKEGDIRLDNGWVVGKDFGHWTQGWVSTSHSAQSRTVRRAVVVQSSLSLPASRAEQMYVSASRAKEKTVFFTDSKAELRQAIQKEDQHISATELVRQQRGSLKQRLLKRIGFLRRLDALAPSPERTKAPEREMHYERN